MGKITKTYMQTAILGKPNPWLVPPTNVFAADWIDTVGAAFGALLGTGLIASGASFLTTGDIDPNRSVAWGSIAAGIVIVIPIAGNTLSELMADIVEGYYRGQERGQPEPEDEPEAEPAPPEPAEDEAGAAPIEGEYWYHSRSGRLCCYPTPRDKNHRLQISDARMQAIFGLALNGTPFSEREMTERVNGLSGPRFRILKRDWCSRALYTMNPDKTGHFTVTGQIVAEVIANHSPTPR